MSEKYRKMIDDPNRPLSMSQHHQQWMIDVRKNPVNAPSPDIIWEYFNKPKEKQLKYETREELIEACMSYFMSHIVPATTKGENGEDIIVGWKWHGTISIGGLALAIGSNRNALRKWPPDHEFGDIIINAKNIVESFYENAMLEVKNPNGIKFILMNNYGWSEKSVLEITNPQEHIYDRESLEQAARDALSSTLDPSILPVDIEVELVE